jgi:5'-nucleotidase
MLEKKMPKDVDLIKIDVPVGATRETPWVLTRQSRYRHYFPVPTKRKHVSEKGPVGYEIRNDPERTEKDSDIYAIMVEKKVSVTPISIDLTSRTDFNALKELLTS